MYVEPLNYLVWMFYNTVPIIKWYARMFLEINYVESFYVYIWACVLYMKMDNRCVCVLWFFSFYCKMVLYFLLILGIGQLVHLTDTAKVLRE